MQHMEVPRLGVELELQPEAYTSAMCDLSRVFNPLSEARDQTHNLMVPSWVH